MAAITLTGTHTVAGILTGGKKMVITNITTDDGEEAGTLVIKPLQMVTEWAFYVKDPGAAATTTYEATMSGNTLTVDPTGVPTGCVLTVVSFGY